MGWDRSRTPHRISQIGYHLLNNDVFRRCFYFYIERANAINLFSIVLRKISVVL